MIIPIIAMVGLPIMIAAQGILLRQLRSMSEYTVSSYQSFSMAIIYGLMMFTPGNDLNAVAQNFEFLDWLILFSLGITSSLIQICRTRSAQYEEPAKLSIVQYF